jgi:tetratricopeptide (TPR) repeat protein
MPRPRPIPELTRMYAQAVECIQAGRLDEAERLGSRIRKLLPDSHEGVHLIGVVKLQRGHAGAALPLIEAALKINPQASDVWSNRALALAMLGRDDEALASFARSLELRADDPDMFNGRGRLLLKLHRPGEALADFERAEALAPGHFGALTNRGNALGDLGRHEEALAQYEALLADHPAHPALHFNRGHVLARLDRHAEAIAAYDQALASRPDYAAAHLNRGTVLQALNRHAEALASFAQVLALDADNADARHNAALSRLTLGDYRGGFKQYEARLARSGMPARRRLGKPLWLGEFPPQRKTILLHAEQGLGDTIQLARYVPLLARMGATVVLEVPSELAGLLGRLEGVTAVVARGAPLPAFDLHCPMGSLPLALATQPDSIPAAIPYLTASAERIAQWQPRLASVPQPRVAFVWSGRPSHPNDRNRSLPLARLAPLLQMGHVSFISVQPDVSVENAAVLAGLGGVTALGAELRDFEDTAAVLGLCDLVVTVDTAVAHLAGALGRPTWILLPFAPDWRWMLERTDSAWYPTARLYRQPAAGDWESVIARVRADLAGREANIASSSRP